MFASTRNWLRRNKTPIAIGAGVVGSAYFLGYYVLNKITEARQRMRDDSIGKENLKRRFTQNQEDCLYTTLALLPTATDNVMRALPVEDVLEELQARKTEKMGRGGSGGAGLMSSAASELAPTEGGTESVAGTEEGSGVRESFVHASRELGGAGAGDGEVGESRADGDGATSGKAARVLSGKSKVLLWEELKIQSITRALTLLYVLPLLTLLTRIQLNLLGRRTYLSSVVSLAAPPPQQGVGGTAQSPDKAAQPAISLENHDDDRSDYYGNDFDTNRRYLTFSWWLLHRGWNAIRGEVEAAVEDVFGALSPRDSVSFERLAELVLEVRKRVEGRDDEERRERRWLSYLLPPREEEEAVLRESGMLDGGSPPLASEEDDGVEVEPDMTAVPGEQGSVAINGTLRRLLDETSDLIDSPAFSHVLTLLLDSAFSLLVDTKVAAEAYKMPSHQPAPSSLFSGSDQRVVDVTEEPDIKPTAKLVTILAVFTRQAAVIGRGGEESLAAVGSMQSIGLAGSIGGEAPGMSEANEYLACIERVRDLEAFAAVVYSSNFEFEGLNDELEQDARAGEEEKRLPTSKSLGDSLVDVGADVEGKLESAWDKALSTSR